VLLGEFRGGEERVSREGGGSSWLLIVFIAVVMIGVGVAVVPLITNAIEQDRLADHGVPAPARILVVRETNTRANHRWVFEVDLQVFPEKGGSYRASVSQPFSVRNAGLLREGEYATVHYDQLDRESLVIVSLGGPPPPSLATKDVVPKEPSQEEAGRKEDTTTRVVDPVCARTYACCMVAMSDAAEPGCDSFLTKEVPPAGCAAALSTYESAAAKAGRTCP